MQRRMSMIGKGSPSQGRKSSGLTIPVLAKTSVLGRLGPPLSDVANHQVTKDAAMAKLQANNNSLVHQLARERLEKARLKTDLAATRTEAAELRAENNRLRTTAVPLQDFTAALSVMQTGYDRLRLLAQTPGQDAGSKANRRSAPAAAASDLPPIRKGIQIKPRVELTPPVEEDEPEEETTELGKEANEDRDEEEELGLSPIAEAQEVEEDETAHLPPSNNVNLISRRATFAADNFDLDDDDEDFINVLLPSFKPGAEKKNRRQTFVVQKETAKPAQKTTSPSKGTEQDIAGPSKDGDKVAEKAKKAPVKPKKTPKKKRGEEVTAPRTPSKDEKMSEEKEASEEPLAVGTKEVTGAAKARTKKKKSMAVEAKESEVAGKKARTKSPTPPQPLAIVDISAGTTEGDETTGSLDTEGDKGRRSTRTRGSRAAARVSYTEPPLNKKLRRD